jgi:hypothetical protein
MNSHPAGGNGDDDQDAAGDAQVALERLVDLRAGRTTAITAADVRAALGL